MKKHNTIKSGFPDAENPLTIYKSSITYLQEDPDCDDLQELKIVKELMPEPVITIHTDKWSIDSFEKLKSLLEDFNSRIEEL